jgi:hypothetical protein
VNDETASNEIPFSNLLGTLPPWVEHALASNSKKAMNSIAGRYGLG